MSTRHTPAGSRRIMPGCVPTLGTSGCCSRRTKQCRDLAWVPLRPEVGDRAEGRHRPHRQGIDEGLSGKRPIVEDELSRAR